MIYSHNMISGYLCLQGSFMYHLPMLIAMLVYIRIPEEDALRDTFPSQDTSDSTAEFFGGVIVSYRIDPYSSMHPANWFVFASIMHGFLGLMHIVDMIQE